MRRAPSLQRRLLMLLAVLVGSIALAVGVRTWLEVSHELDELLDAHLAQAAALLVAQQTPGHDDDHDEVDTPSLHPYAPKVTFQVFHEGRLVRRSANAPASPLVDPGSGFRTGLRTVTHEGDAWRVFAAFGSERDIQVYVGEQQALRDDILHAALTSTLTPLALALPLLALAVWWSVRHALGPMNRLGRTLAQRRPQSLEPVDDPEAPAEMRPLLTALNGLFGRIATLLDNERRFTADAAHELRTPIAAIRAQAQAAGWITDEPGRQRALQATLAGCDRASRLVEQLLTLSRLDSDGPRGTQAVDLRQAARHMVAELAPSAIDHGQSVELAGADATDDAVVIGDPVLLQVLLRNLLDNAIRHAGGGATIVVQVDARAGAGARLVVDDDGPGLEPAALARLGERFYRPTGTEAAGSGLGWSIVRRIATVHGAVARALRSERGGLRVEVDFAPAVNGTAPL